MAQSGSFSFLRTSNAGPVLCRSHTIGFHVAYVGSNNVALLAPEGQFGTRLQGGKDAASPRYIFTRLEKIARAIFHSADDNLLQWMEDDGQPIEPSWYCFA